MYADYRVPTDLKPKAAPTGRAYWWADIVSRWDLVALDLSERHHVDLHDPAVLARPWPGIRGMILGLLRVDSHLATALRE